LCLVFTFILPLHPDFFPLKKNPVRFNVQVRK
jgi:hypothetical protein